jgi:hypothetical protein
MRGDSIILNEDDPISNIAQRVTNAVYDNSDLHGDVLKLVLRELRLPEETGIGGDDSDEEEFWENAIDKYGEDYVRDMRRRNEIAYISELHPKHEQLWDMISLTWSMVFAQCIAAGKFRFTPEFVQRRQQ